MLRRTNIKPESSMTSEELYNVYLKQRDFVKQQISDSSFCFGAAIDRYKDLAKKCSIDTKEIEAFIAEADSALKKMENFELQKHKENMTRALELQKN